VSGFDLHSDDIGSTIEVTYDTKEAGLTYKTATNLAVFPENTYEDAHQVAKLLGYDLSQRFAFKSNPNFESKRSTAAKHPFPTPCTVQEALTKYVDLRGALRKKLLSDLIPHCINEEDKQK
jgi:NADPH-ferrihemoprotein reductase